MLPTTQFAYRKGPGTCDALLCLSYTLQSALERGQEARSVQIDFSAAFDWVNYQEILYKLCSVGIGGSVLSILTQFLSDRSQYVMVDGCRSKLVNVVSGVPQGRVLGPLLFLLYISELFYILENKLIGYADDSTLIAVMPSPGLRVAVAESLGSGLVKVNEWCDLWGMKLNASKTKTMIVSRSRTMHPQSAALTIGGTMLKESDDLVILGVTFDSKMTFEKHLRSVSISTSQRLGILTKSWQVLHDRSLLLRCFRGFVLPVLEYCSAGWCSAADTTLRLLDRVVSGASFLTPGVFECDPARRRSVAVLCMLYKIRCNPMHSLCGALPVPYVPVRVTRSAVIAQRFTYAPPRCRTSQYLRTFITLSVSLWNDLSDPVFDCVRLAGFKSRANDFLLALLLAHFLSPAVFPLSSFILWVGVLWGLGLRTDRVLIALSQPCIANLF